MVGRSTSFAPPTARSSRASIPSDPRLRLGHSATGGRYSERPACRGRRSRRGRLAGGGSGEWGALPGAAGGLGGTGVVEDVVRGAEVVVAAEEDEHLVLGGDPAVHRAGVADAVVGAGSAVAVAVVALALLTLLRAAEADHLGIRTGATEAESAGGRDGRQR